MSKKKVPTCRVCGCTDEDACEGGCYWVEKDLCSACVETAGRVRSIVEGTPEPPGKSQAVLVVTEVPEGVELRTFGTGLAHDLARVLAQLGVKLRGGLAGGDPDPRPARRPTNGRKAR